MKKIFCILLCLTIMFSFSSKVKAADEHEIRQLKRLINTRESDEVINLLLKAQEEGLSVDGLINKVREGAAKQVEVQKILEVLYIKRQYLKDANKVLEDAEKNGLRIWENEKLESMEEIALSIEVGIRKDEFKNLVKIIVKNNENFSYLLKCSSAYTKMIKAKLPKEVIQDIVFLSAEKNINAYLYEDITDFLVDARRYDYPLNEVVDKLKIAIKDGKDIQSFIFDFKFSR